MNKQEAFVRFAPDKSIDGPHGMLHTLPAAEAVNTVATYRKKPDSNFRQISILTEVPPDEIPLCGLPLFG